MKDTLTDDDGVVVRDEHLAVNVDELSHQFSFQVSVSPETSEGNVVHPLFSHWKQAPDNRRHSLVFNKHLVSCPTNKKL